MTGMFFSALSADFEPTVRLTRRVYLLPALYGRVLIGRDIAIPYLNYVGGEVAGRYMNQQLPFTVSIICRCSIIRWSWGVYS